MSLAGKRKRADGKDNLTAEESKIYNLIKSKESMGIWMGDIRKELGMTNVRAVQNCIKSLLLKQMVKEVADIQAKGKKRLLAKEFEPSKELTGGVWYDEGRLDTDLIDNLKRLSLQTIRQQQVATPDSIRNILNKFNAVTFDITSEQVKEILKNMVLEKEVIEVRSTGIGEFVRVPKATLCYKIKPKSVKVGALASIPCGVCTRIRECSPGGIISPATCEYYTKWFEF